MPNTLEQQACPFKWGDRIDHAVFGLGTVSGEPKAVCGGSSDYRRIENRGWVVPVEWDDPTRTATRVGHSHLRLVTRPNAKGGAYWRNEFSKHAAAVAGERSRSDNLIQRSFRPINGPSLSDLRQQILKEQSRLEALLDFLERDSEGKHA